MIEHLLPGRVIVVLNLAPDRFGDRWHDMIGQLETDQRHKENTVREVSNLLRRAFERQPRFTDAPWSGQRDQPGVFHKTRKPGEFGFPTNERGELGG